MEVYSLWYRSSKHSLVKRMAEKELAYQFDQAARMNRTKFKWNERKLVRNSVGGVRRATNCAAKIDAARLILLIYLLPAKLR